MELAAELWSRLPFEMVERVLSFLPVPDLCRYAVVCRKWNSLISNPEFAAFCIQNAKRQGALFIITRYISLRGSSTDEASDAAESRGLSILDLQARRWYRVRKYDDWVMDSGIAAMDGGLVCQYLNLPYFNSSRYVVEPIVIYNPIASSKKVYIPYSQVEFDHGYPRIAMAVDAMTHEYKIFHISGDILPKFHSKTPFMLVYDSTTKEWQSSTEPSRAMLFGVDSRMCLCSAVFQGVLYAVMDLPINDRENQLWSYSISQDTWEDAGVHIRGCILDSPQLIGVAGNRLFLVTWLLWKVHWGGDGSRWQLEVSEIIIPDGALVTLFVMTKALVLQVFGAEAANTYGCPGILAFGFGKSIILMSKRTGVLVVYDLATRSWDVLPRDPFGPHPGREKDFSCYAKHMNLILPCCKIMDEDDEMGDDEMTSLIRLHRTPPS